MDQTQVTTVARRCPRTARFPIFTALLAGLTAAACGGGGGGGSSAPPGGGGGGNNPPGVNDPIFGRQWHLLNTGQDGGTPGEDANVLPVWNAPSSLSGAGVRISIVDDGLDIGHEDLAPNVVPGQSHDYVSGGDDPTGGSHGTSCGGVAAAAGNDIGVRGASFNAELVGYNVLQALNTANEVDAMTRNMASISISSNSWGAPDGRGIPQPSSSDWRMAVSQGVSQGRGGLGTLYFWAAGNGDQVIQGPVDNSNLDGQANFPLVMAIGALRDDGRKAGYSENGANLLICAHSNGDPANGITTTDRMGSAGYNDGNSGENPNANYTDTFGGTSSATPLVAGVAGLILEANPALGWRDVRTILATSARQNHPGDAGWVTNGAGHLVNHKYGFGVVDAEAAVALATGWQNLPPLQGFLSALSEPNVAIPDGDPTGVTDSISITGSNIQRIEMVEILFSSADHTWSSDLEVVLTSPSGTESVLAERHSSINNPPPYDNWVFSSARHLDEPADGTWTLTVRDLVNQDSGTFQGWRLNFLGH
ncbi:MAG: S8 family peptidase [Planctomycetota bacterium]